MAGLQKWEEREMAEVFSAGPKPVRGNDKASGTGPPIGIFCPILVDT